MSLIDKCLNEGMNQLINSNLTAVLNFRKMNIGAGAAKLNTSAQRCSQENCAGFEPVVFR